MFRALLCSSSGGQNCITQPLVSSHLTRGCVMQFWPPDDEHMCSKHVEAWNKLIAKHKCCAHHHTHRCDDTRGCVMQFWPPDDEHMCSKHVEAWNKLIAKHKCCASSWLNTEINIRAISLVEFCGPSIFLQLIHQAINAFKIYNLLKVVICILLTELFGLYSTYSWICFT